MKYITTEIKYAFAKEFAIRLDTKLRAIGITDGYVPDIYATEAGFGINVVFANGKDTFIYELHGGKKLLNALINEHQANPANGQHIVVDVEWEMNNSYGRA